MLYDFPNDFSFPWSSLQTLFWFGLERMVLWNVKPSRCKAHQHTKMAYDFFHTILFSKRRQDLGLLSHTLAEWSANDLSNDCFYLPSCTTFEDFNTGMSHICIPCCMCCCSVHGSSDLPKLAESDPMVPCFSEESGHYCWSWTTYYYRNPWLVLKLLFSLLE
jgi:hypothetical protein